MVLLLFLFLSVSSSDSYSYSYSYVYSFFLFLLLLLFLFVFYDALFYLTAGGSNLLGPLGWLLDPLEAMKNSERFFDDKSFRSISLFRGGLGRQSRPKMAPKTSQKLRRFSRAKKLLFKRLLEPSWADLKAFWEPSWVSKNRCGIGRRSVWWKFTFLMLISFQDAIWTQLGRSWPPKGPKMTPRWRPKTAQNRSKIESKK